MADEDSLIPTMDELKKWMLGDIPLSSGVVLEVNEAGAKDQSTPNEIVSGFRRAPYVTIGIHESAGMHTEGGDSGVSIAEVAFYNEFGTEDKEGNVHIPERPFMRTTYEEKKNEHAAFFEQCVHKILDGKMRAQQALGLLGQKVSADIKAKITAIRDPANSPATLAGKYPKTNPLINSGQMRNSVTYVVHSGVEDGK